MPTQWHPCGLLNNHPQTPYAVIILNQPINNNALSAVIHGASLLVCADGGANRLRKYEQDKLATSQTPRVPDAIIGDLDSLLTETESHYRKLGVKVIKDPDQNATDFTKCLKFTREWVSSQSNPEPAELDVMVLGGLGGRVDQGFSQIHHLFMAENDPSLLQGRIYLLSEQSLSFVLGDGQNLIHTEPGYFEENVGIIPVLGRTLITTQGLEWDVKDWPSEFGGQVSTSNHIRSDLITITFDGPRPLFTMELERRLSSAGD